MSLAASIPGCGTGERINPSYSLTLDRAESELQWMRNNPVTLSRPVVVLGGWGDMTGLPPAYLAEQLRKAIGDDQVMSIGFGMCHTFDACRCRVLKRVEAAYPSGVTNLTREVDVIGFSMGGLVARYAAAPPGDDETVRRLKIARLYTISSPHRGALMSKIVAPGQLAKDMREGSDFLKKLDDNLALADYPVIPYVRMADTIVGAQNAAPRGQTPWWLPAKPWSRSHSDAYRDPRLIAELARRLRNEKPYTTDPATAVPK
jgi:hypothetical protein